MPNWTDEQLKAINEDGKNIIVSAGAGSGKTAVLSERVLRKLKQGININELLILTFTNAAAKEMKERIRKKIQKENQLKDQLDLIDEAYITTFDSFSLSTVKKYHYLLNISPNVQIIDESLIELRKNKILDEIFEEKYNDELFKKLISDFCVKDDDNIKNYILNISKKLDLKTNKVEYLNRYINNYFNDERINEDINLYVKLLLKKINYISELTLDISFLVDGEYYNKFSDTLSKLINSKTYEEILNNVDISLPNLPKGSDNDVKKIKEDINGILKELKGLCKYEDIDDMKRQILSTKDYVEVIIDIILKLDDKIKQYKFTNDMYEFNDIALLAIDLLKNNEDVRLEMKNYFNEIMIDEYQDTSDIQEEFISLISNNNVYMVGDIKQSIYKFRNANPYIFKNKYDNYSDLNGGIKIDLNKNFRSRNEVINNINLIFENIMDDYIGGADYKKSHRMIFGNNSYIEKGNVNQNNNLQIYNYSFDRQSTYKKEEVEAFIIANDIKEKIDNKYKIFDKDKLIIRNANYSDFVILMDRSTNFLLYKKIFEYLGIPLTIYKDEKITEDILLSIIKNILSLIIDIHENRYDVKFKYEFISILRSPLYEVEDSIIFDYFLDNNFKENDLYNKCKEICEYIDNTSIKNIIEIVIDKFNFYDNFIKIGNIQSNIVKLDYIKNISENFSKIGYTIKDFINYLTEIISKKYDITFNQNKDDNNSVRIMTIHKSKGLEYSICYYPGLYPSFNISDLNERFMYSNKYGIICSSFNDGIDTTIYKELLKDDYINEEISEEIRLFYVALTRAKEKMIIVMDINDDNYITKSPLDSNVREKYRSFKDVILSIHNLLDSNIFNIDLDKLNISKDYNLIKNNNYLDYINIVDQKVKINEINIENNIIKEDSYSKKINKLIDNETKNNIILGTKIHYVLELVDLKNPNLDKIRVDDFIKNKVNKLLKNDVFKNVKDATVYKEYEFMYEKDDIVHHGIIDLMLIYDDKIDIIDYKLKNIEDENYILQLNGYKEYIKTKFNKETNIYLYSIIDEKIKKI